MQPPAMENRPAQSMAVNSGTATAGGQPAPTRPAAKATPQSTPAIALVVGPREAVAS